MLFLLKKNSWAKVMVSQLLLTAVSAALLVSTLIPSLWSGTRRKKLANEPNGLTIIYPRPIAPLSRK